MMVPHFATWGYAEEVLTIISANPFSPGTIRASSMHNPVMSSRRQLCSTYTRWQPSQVCTLTCTMVLCWGGAWTESTRLTRTVGTFASPNPPAGVGWSCLCPFCHSWTSAWCEIHNVMPSWWHTPSDSNIWSGTSTLRWIGVYIVLAPKLTSRSIRPSKVKGLCTWCLEFLHEVTFAESCCSCHFPKQAAFCNGDGCPTVNDPISWHILYQYSHTLGSAPFVIYPPSPCVRLHLCQRMRGKGSLTG